MLDEKEKEIISQLEEKFLLLQERVSQRYSEIKEPFERVQKIFLTTEQDMQAIDEGANILLGFRALKNPGTKDVMDFGNKMTAVFLKVMFL